MRKYEKIIIVAVVSLIIFTSTIAAVLPREQDCNKYKALSISSDILSDKIRIQVYNTSVCTYEGFLWVEVRDTNYEIPREGGQFAKLFTFSPKSFESYEANLPTLIHGKTYWLSVFVNEKTPDNKGKPLVIYEKQFVFGE